jgi:1-hydroxycarotenoid 3,4-desaturase
MDRESPVVVVGAGVAGLACAVDLAAQGIDVVVLERAERVGGKMRQVDVDGAAIDAGPTVFTMRWVFEELLDAAGTSLDAEVRTRPLSLLARHAWRTDERLDLFADPERSTDAIGDFAGAAEARRFRAFCAEAARVHDALLDPYIRAPRPSLAGMAAGLGLGGLAALARLRPPASLWSALGRHFTDPRLRQLFGRYATYCGTSPWGAPATLVLVAHVEMAGVWAIDGGMHGLARALARVAERRGARIRTGAACSEIIVRHGRAAGVRLASGEVIEASAVVFNGDAAALAAGLLGDDARRATAPVRPADRSLSALTWAIHARTTGFPLAPHTVFFSDDYAAEFDDIFVGRRLPRQPTLYICAQDRGDDATAPATPRERLFCIVNAPAAADVRPLDPKEIEACERSTFALAARAGLAIDGTTAAQVTTGPAQFASLFPGTGGAIYGRAGHGWNSPFARPGAASRIPGLYLAGGSVHPGPGVPMAALSGRLAAATVMARRASTIRSPRVAMSGGT